MGIFVFPDFKQQSVARVGGQPKKDCLIKTCQMTGALVTRKLEPDEKIRLCSYFATGKESPQFSQKERHKKG